MSPERDILSDNPLILQYKLKGNPMERPGFGLNRIGQIAVNVRDLDRAVAFYRYKLGMKHLFTVPKMAFFDCGGIRLMLGLPEKPEFDHPSSILYYSVDDIHGAFQIMTDRDVPFETKPHVVVRMEGRDLWMAFLRDSEGNLLALMSEQQSRQAKQEP